MVCLDRDRGAICCYSGGARLLRGLAAGAGPGDRRRRGQRSGRRSPVLAPRWDLRPQTAPGMLRAPDPDAEAGMSCGRSSLPEPGAGRWRAQAAGVGTGTPKRAARPPRCWNGLVKSLKKIHICVVSSAEGVNLYSFSPPLPRNYPTYSERQHLCRTVCVCLVQVESCPYKLCSVDFRFRCVPGVFFLSSCKHGRLWCWGVA